MAGTATWAVALLAAAAAAVGAPAARADQAVTHQGNAAHTGYASEPGLDPPLRRVWSRRFPDVVSYPVRT